MKSIDLIPYDTLFFRDSRPLSAGSSFGRGAHWPFPITIHGALRSALLALNGIQPTSKKNGYMRKGKPHGKMGSEAFNWLHIHGPFPINIKTNELFLPTPFDIHSKPFETDSQLSNLPQLLRYPVVSTAPPSKKQKPAWICFQSFKNYLEGKEITLTNDTNDPLWYSEYRIGIGLDPRTQTVKEGQFFAAEHLRLKDDFGLRIWVNSPPNHKERNPLEDGLLAEHLCGLTLTVGGEGRFCFCRSFPEEKDELMSLQPQLNSNRLKWVLLSPAIFAKGWLPGWICDKSGNVLLREVKKEERREFRRKRREEGWEYQPENDPSPPIEAKLVAACIGKQIVINGWELAGGSASGPRPTLLAVPAGSVYYFEAKDKNEANKLASVLHRRCRSDFFGEKGLGFGVCGSWQFLKIENDSKTSEEKKE
ncbi:type III-B CRISPR module-associated protein Cmr3 [Methylacidiphilum caldifontis]|uniref:Type III-B CRISPR module-associated protein Cmr3 n=1 Tax=Methylacidiphilum caldifontis TaxID=2795386 RepID=A0A4Y8P6X1_9BACT|nr:type III-B CRISPR module-associated protein Cmr3 [Methylacidiphilum caldifontis]TFE65873.1 type III-B CRISPR module-associated protein Cmr3 [Methylacidiphilum caldifontis]